MLESTCEACDSPYAIKGQIPWLIGIVASRTMFSRASENTNEKSTKH
jgi:hypothetical protein